MTANFQKPTGFERFFGTLLGKLIAFGMAPGYMRVLETRGRKTGRVYSTPVNLIEHDGKTWLVAPRGATQWTKNVEASGDLALRRGGSAVQHKIRITSPAERAPVLKKYLEAYPSQVQRFFQVKAGEPLEAFAKVTQDHPVYELLPGA
ncbi:MAG TPA: nitroreductase family deazaflavin-dependent oxidoreductase [Polyangiales bacterium]|jgi:deazaflavin-dependent oxidoreductase (nitroreductase family)|nr:nitroreductase family deazaflavin-dependent oxidoreductase [Polyangiales bacterium]